jgi:RNA polymerase sigma-70 factor (ECF subfamily)
MGFDPTGPIFQQMVSAARTAWPELRVDEPAFAAHVAGHLEGEDDVEATLASLAAADLYLACACARSESAALELLDKRYFSALDAALGKMGLSSAQIDDIKQGLRQQLLVATETAPPRIAQYGGRGALAGWLRVSATRAGLKVARAAKREVAHEDDDLLAMPTTTTPELQRLKRDYQADFRAAFLGAMAALPDRDKNLLRQHHLDGLSVDELAVLYKVHRATAARWVAAARQALLTATRQALLARVRLAPTDADSIMRLVHSQLDITLRRLLE